MNEDTVKYNTITYLRPLCVKGSTKVLKYVIKKENFSCLKLIETLCRYKHLDIINTLPTNHGVIYANDGLAGACKGGHMDMIELMISRGANNWTRALHNACEGGHMDIVKLMISKGGELKSDDNDLHRACKGGNMDIVNMIIEKKMIENWRQGFAGACKGGNIDIVFLMISKMEEHDMVNWDWGFACACRGGHIEIVKLLSSKFKEKLDINYGIICAHESGHTNIVNFLLSEGGTMSRVKPNFPCANIKTRYYHNDTYFCNDNGYYHYYRNNFMHMNIIYWTIVYSMYAKKDVMQKDLTSSLIKLMYF